MHTRLPQPPATPASVPRLSSHPLPSASGLHLNLKDASYPRLRLQEKPPQLGRDFSVKEVSDLTFFVLLETPARLRVPEIGRRERGWGGCSRTPQGHQEGGAARSRGGSLFSGAVSSPVSGIARLSPLREREINTKKNLAQSTVFCGQPGPPQSLVHTEGRVYWSLTAGVHRAPSRGDQSELEDQVGRQVTPTAVQALGERGDPHAGRSGFWMLGGSAVPGG